MPWSPPYDEGAALHETSIWARKKRFYSLTTLTMKKILISLSDKQYELMLYLMEQDLATNKSAWLASIFVAEKLRRDRDTTPSR